MSGKNVVSCFVAYPSCPYFRYDAAALAAWNWCLSHIWSASFEWRSTIMHASIINIAIYYKIRLKIYIKLLFNDVYVILDVFFMGKMNLFVFSDRELFTWRTQENRVCYCSNTFCYARYITFWMITSSDRLPFGSISVGKWWTATNTMFIRLTSQVYLIYIYFNAKENIN